MGKLESQSGILVLIIVSLLVLPSCGGDRYEGVMGKSESRTARIRRHHRVRAKVEGTISRPRLCVFRSLNHIYAQVIDDSQGHTLISASTHDPEIKGNGVAGKVKAAKAELVGSLLAERALSKGISQVVFDRGGYKYHGRVKALAEAARQKGLKF